MVTMLQLLIIDNNKDHRGIIIQEYIVMIINEIKQID